MRVAVIGAGAVGGYFGGQLAAAGIEVVFLARGATLQALRRSGLRIDSPFGDLRLASVQASDQPQDIGVVDAVLVAVKAWQVAEVAESMAPLVGEHTVVLPLQNGVEAADQLAAVYGDKRVLGGMCRIVAMQVAPGHIDHLGVEPFIALGDLTGRPNRPAEALLGILHQADIAARIPFDIRSSIWQKMLFVAPVSGVGAVTRATLGGMRSLPETRRLLEQAMAEISAVARARKVMLRDDAVDRTMAFLDGMPEEATTSMQRDLLEGRPSELEALSGAVVRIGGSLGIDTPVHRFLYASLLPAERAARKQATA